jgi:hypothetical protein
VPALEVVHEVLGNQRDALFRADQRLQRGPLGLQLLLVFEFLAFSRLLEVLVQTRPFFFLQFQPGQAAFVVDGHGRAVLDRPLNVVNADVIAEHGPRVGVGLLDRRAGEAYERGARQRVAHVAGKTVDEVILAAMRLVSDHD